ncbi:ATP-binding protein [Streptomyces sp. NEAU-S7GS2]|uniref:ATP-binding protein n=1 Tax=Streptomyces sp. NEAU-S7GS2 TaxID=2202000 RepID=UPI000D6FD281|nr:ATP-binding protein [Streptomyces sp. NEAU-S7GS2]AWN32612.1 hypothetical protein DKG71_42285 [Streptomyces sp. NEAU-S7GS2]
MAPDADENAWKDIARECLRAFDVIMMPTAYGLTPQEGGRIAVQHLRAGRMLLQPILDRYVAAARTPVGRAWRRRLVDRSLYVKAFEEALDYATGRAEGGPGTNWPTLWSRDGRLPLIQQHTQDRRLLDDEESAGTGVPPLDLAPGTLLVAVGPGAAGKSTYADTAAVDAVICLDSLRRELSKKRDAGDQSVTPAAVERQNALLEQYLSAGTTVFLDSTNVEVHVRAGLVERARQHGRPVVALIFLPDLATCRARNRLRPTNRRVPDHVLTWQFALAQEATPQTLLAEGFTAAYEIITDRP